MPKVYDCFLFNGEFDLLEIRLKTHWDKVDKFIIVEGNRTFQGDDKKYSLLHPPKDLLSYMEKIEPVFFDVPIFKEKDGSWLAMALQRDSIIRGLTKCLADDLVIFSEVDEIIRPEKIALAANLISSETAESVIFQHEQFCYYLNVRDGVWSAAIMLKFGTVIRKRLSPQTIRNNECFSGARNITLFKSGWHFQNLGGPERVVKKLKSSCHGELGDEKYSNYEVVAGKIKDLIEPLERDDHKLTVVKIDESYPECICKEQEKYQHLIYRAA